MGDSAQGTLFARSMVFVSNGSTGELVRVIEFL
jgi:hypothetical protein